jgi:CrcB protein
VNTWKALLLVGTGGFLGSCGRYLVGGWVHGSWPNVAFPIGTLAVNVLGCLLIGLLAGLFEQRQAFGPEARLFLMIGVLGGFTTYSSFAYETLALARDAEFARALVNVGLQTVLGLAAAWLGWTVVRP